MTLSGLMFECILYRIRRTYYFKLVNSTARGQVARAYANTVVSAPCKMLDIMSHARQERNCHWRTDWMTKADDDGGCEQKPIGGRPYVGGGRYMSAALLWSFVAIDSVLGFKRASPMGHRWIDVHVFVRCTHHVVPLAGRHRDGPYCEDYISHCSVYQAFPPWCMGCI